MGKLFSLVFFSLFLLDIFLLTVATDAQLCYNKELFNSGKENAEITCSISGNSLLTSENITIMKTNITNDFVSLDQFVFVVNATAVKVVIPDFNYTQTGEYTCRNRNTLENIISTIPDIPRPCAFPFVYLRAGFKPKLPVFSVQLLNKRLIGSFYPDLEILTRNTMIGDSYRTTLSLSFSSYSLKKYEPLKVTGNSFESTRDIIEAPQKICFNAKISNKLGQNTLQWCNRTSHITQPEAVKESEIDLKISSHGVTWKFPLNSEMKYPDWGFNSMDSTDSKMVFYYEYSVTLRDPVTSKIIYGSECLELDCGKEDALKKIRLHPFREYQVIVYRQLITNDSFYGLKSLPTIKNFTTLPSNPEPISWPNKAFLITESTDFIALELFWKPLKTEQWNDKSGSYEPHVVQDDDKRYCLPGRKTMCKIKRLMKYGNLNVTIKSSNSVGKSFKSPSLIIDLQNEWSSPKPIFDVEKVNNASLYQLRVYLDNLVEKPSHVSAFTCKGSLNFCDNMMIWTKTVDPTSQSVDFLIDVPVDRHTTFFSSSFKWSGSWGSLAPKTKCFYGGDENDKSSMPEVFATVKNNRLLVTFDAVTCNYYSQSRARSYIVKVWNGDIKKFTFSANQCNNLESKCSFEKYLSVEVQSSPKFLVQVQLENNEVRNVSTHWNPIKITDNFRNYTTWMIVSVSIVLFVFAFVLVVRKNKKRAFILVQCFRAKKYTPCDAKSSDHGHQFNRATDGDDSDGESSVKYYGTDTRTNNDQAVTHTHLVLSGDDVVEQSDNSRLPQQSTTQSRSTELEFSDSGDAPHSEPPYDHATRLSNSSENQNPSYGDQLFECESGGTMDEAQKNSGKDQLFEGGEFSPQLI